jgi:hypothetical protein
MKQLTKLFSLATMFVAGALVTQPLTAMVQADPHTGTWVLNVTKSKYAPGPAPKEQTSIYTVKGDTLTVSTKGTSPDGKPLSTDFTATFDSKDYPVKGNPDWDAVSAKRVDSHTIEFTRKRASKVVQTSRSVVSKDGQTRTITTTGRERARAEDQYRWCV